jgi:sensor histidine kinase regulating citrate/malate metabolism
VPEEIRSCFFDKYVTRGKKTGTGLGTYSAALAARTQKGDISMETSEETGTVITVRLPKTC